MPDTKPKKTFPSLMNKELLLSAFRLMTTAKTLSEKYEENKRSLKNIDKLSEFFETEEFKKEMEEHKKKIEAIRLKNENAIPWISYGFYLVIFIYGCVFVHAWLREYRKQTPTKRT